MVDLGTNEVRGVVAPYPIALDYVLRVVLLVDRDGSLLSVTGNIHAEYSRHVTHAHHLETVHKLRLEFIQQVLVGVDQRPRRASG